MSARQSIRQAAEQQASSPDASDAMPNAEDYLTIGALAELCGVTVRTLRYYEEMDLIGPVKRTAGKYRLYNAQSAKRVKAILALQDLNYSLDEILAALGAYSLCKDHNKQQRIEHTRQSLMQQAVYINEKLDKLLALKQEIDDRLKMLDANCSPCQSEAHEATCREDCQYLSVHN